MSSIPSSSPSHFPHANATVQRIFINVEDESPNRFFSANHYQNVQYLAGCIDFAVEKGIQLGVFTTRQDWYGIMADKVSRSPRSMSTRTDYYRYPTSNTSYVESNPFYHLPLWVPKYDEANNMVSRPPSYVVTKDRTYVVLTHNIYHVMARTSLSRSRVGQRY